MAWHLGVDQRLGADNAARPSTAIDDDKSVGRRHQLLEAIDQLGPGHADRAGDAVRVVFLVGAAVEDHHPLGALLALGELLGGDPRCAVFMLDDFGEGLARHMDAAIDRKPGRLPCLDAALQHRDIAVPAFDQPRRRALGQPFAVIRDDNRRRAPRQQTGRDQLEPAQRQARGHQQMPVVKAALLAGIDDRDLAARTKLVPQLRRRDAAGCSWHSFPPPMDLPFRLPEFVTDVKVARMLATTRGLLFGLRLWASVCLALYVAFWLELDNASWAGASAAIVCQPHLGASLRKGWFRMIGTVVGAVAIVVLTACFPQDRAPFLVGLALWGAACALVATLLRNFAAYAAALAGYTAAIIASDQLGATGGPSGEAFMLAVTRASEICIGIVCAGVVLAGSDLGGARRRLATLFAAISAETTGRFTGTLTQAGSELPDTQPVRRELVRRVTALDPAIDEAFGESSQLRYYSPVLQTAVDGLFAALAGWRTVAVRLARLPHDEARQQVGVVLQSVPQLLRSAPVQSEPARWIGDPVGLRRICEAAVRRLIAQPPATPSLQLLLDQTAEVLAGISHALNGLALLVADLARPVPRRGGVRLRVPDLLPSLVNAGRAFVTIGAVELFWIMTEWPSGALAITFATIGVTLFAPRADQAYATAMGFMVGTGLTAAFAAIIAFAVLPNLETFGAFSLAIGLVLVPAGAGMAQPWQTATFTAMAANFVPLLAPANQMSYDTVQFYNTAVAIVAGVGAAALSFRLIPPLSPAFRTRRLLALALHDLHRLATGPIPHTPNDWESRMYGRFSALPDEAQPLQRSQLLAALSVGSEIIQLRHIARRLNLSSELDAALEAVTRGDSAIATDHLARLDEALAARTGAAALRARGSILAISEALTQHASYFDAGAPG
jgi:uncharacterized membrane protein YccC